MGLWIRSTWVTEAVPAWWFRHSLSVSGTLLHKTLDVLLTDRLMYWVCVMQRDPKIGVGGLTLGEIKQNELIEQRASMWGVSGRGAPIIYMLSAGRVDISGLLRWRRIIDLALDYVGSLKGAVGSLSGLEPWQETLEDMKYVTHWNGTKRIWDDDVFLRKLRYTRTK